MSLVSCHLSHVTFLSFFGTKWWSLLVESLLSTGPTPSSIKNIERKHKLEVPGGHKVWWIISKSSQRGNKIYKYFFRLVVWITFVMWIFSHKKHYKYYILKPLIIQMWNRGIGVNLYLVFLIFWSTFLILRRGMPIPATCNCKWRLNTSVGGYYLLNLDRNYPHKPVVNNWNWQICP